MAKVDLDKLHRQRVTALSNRWKADERLRAEDIFVSQRVVETLPKGKALVTSFRSPEVLSLLPFVPNMYVLVCPKCVDSETTHSFRRLTETGLIVPILTAPYSMYPTPIVDALTGLDHISFYEFDFYRLFSIAADSNTMVCAHCVGERRSKLLASAADLKDNSHRAQQIREVFHNLTPYVGSDAAVLDALERAVQGGGGLQLKRLIDLTCVMRQARTAAAFCAAPVIRDTEVISIPGPEDGIVNDARAIALRVASLVSDGLKLRIPTDVPIDVYIELVHDHRPQIIPLSRQLLDSATSMNEVSLAALMSSINSINRDIERIKNLRRFMIIEALAGFTDNNPALVASALIAGALGLAGYVFGCAAVPAGAAVDFVKRSGKLKGSSATRRLKRKLHSDVQPSLDKLIARYVGTTPITMHVLSIRKNIAEATAPALPKQKRLSSTP